MPFPPIFGNAFKEKIPGRGQSGSVYAPSRQTREAIGRIARRPPENPEWIAALFRTSPRLRPHRAGSRVSAHTLTEIFIRSTNQDLARTVVLGCFMGCRGERITAATIALILRSGKIPNSVEQKESAISQVS